MVKTKKKNLKLLEIEEDIYFDKVASERLKRSKKFVSHENAWKIKA